MNKADSNSLDEQIQLYTQQLMRQYESKGNAPPADYVRPDADTAVDVVPPTISAPPKPVGNTGITPEEEYRLFTNENPQRGILRVQTLTARNTYPVTSVKVVVSKMFESGEYIIATQVTDNAGKTEGLLLPAPNRSLSEHPGNGKKPFADYKVTVMHPNFATIIAKQLPIFAGESSMQILNMIPLSASPSGDTIEYLTTEPSDL